MIHGWYDEFHEQPKHQPKHDLNGDLVMAECTKGRFGSRDNRLHFKIKLLTDYGQNTIEGRMSRILHYFCLVQHKGMYYSCVWLRGM